MFLLRRKCHPILIACIFLPLISYSQNVILLNGGVNHNDIFKSPTLNPDTVVDPSGTNWKAFPAWGGFLSVLDKQSLFQKKSIFLKIGLGFEIWNSVIKIHPETGEYYRKYYEDPAIEEKQTAYTFSLPLFVSYQYKSISFDIGISSSFLRWFTQRFYTVDENTHKSNSDLQFHFHPYFGLRCSYMFIRDKGFFEIGYDHRVTDAFSSNYLRLGIIYNLIKH